MADATLEQPAAVVAATKQQEQEEFQDCQPEEHDVNILYGEDGTPVLLVTGGRQYAIRKGRESRAPPPVWAPPPLPPQHLPVHAHTSRTTTLTGVIIIALNLAIAVAAVTAYGGFHSPVMEWIQEFREERGADQFGLEDPSMRVCLCPSFSCSERHQGERVRANKTWPLHTAATYEDKGNVRFVSEEEIQSGLFDAVMDALAANVVVHYKETGPLLCMHHIAHAIYGENVRACVLLVTDGAHKSVLPLYNLDLKGYSAERNTVIETSVVCGEAMQPLAKVRRLAVDVSYTLSSGLHMRSIVDDKEHAFAIQRVWEEFRGTYACE